MSAVVLFVPWTQHFAKTDEAEDDDALSTREAACNGLLPFRTRFFLENSIVLSTVLANEHGQRVGPKAVDWEWQGRVQPCAVVWWYVNQGRTILSPARRLLYGHVRGEL
jgi:hypothetical protein